MNFPEVSYYNLSLAVWTACPDLFSGKVKKRFTYPPRADDLEIVVFHRMGSLSRRIAGRWNAYNFFIVSENRSIWVQSKDEMKRSIMQNFWGD